MRCRPKWLAVLALAASAAAAIVAAVPATQSIAVSQAAGLLGMPNQLRAVRGVVGLVEPRGGAERRAPMSVRPGDPYELQLAAALASDMSQRPGRLEALVPRFPGSASLRAHILRSACASRLRMARAESAQLLGQAVRTPPPRSTVAELRALERNAVAGERLDPGNAYFAYLRSMCLLAMRRDSEAIAALRRAGAAPRWSDYAMEEPRVLGKLTHTPGQPLGALPRIIAATTTLFPHYAQMRDAARVFAQIAANREAGGHPREGIAIRHALMRYGSLMRSQSPAIIGNLVGIALAAVATSRPGNEPVRRRPDHVTADLWTQMRRDRYLTFVQAEAGPAQAAWARDELAAGARVRDGVRGAMDRLPYSPTVFAGLAILWLGGALLLGVAAWHLAAGAAAHASSRSRYGGCLFAAGAVLLLVIVGATSARWVDEVVNVGMVLAGSENPGAPLWVKLLVGAVVACVPVLVTAALLGAASAQRVPRLPRLARGLTACGLVLLLCYAGLVGVTASREARLNALIDRCEEHEGRYALQLVGQGWPGPAPVPPGVRP